MAFHVLLFRLCHAGAMVLIIVLAGCASLPRVPFTAQQQVIAQIPGIPDARFWADSSAEDFAASMRMGKMRAAAAEIGSLNTLALSGGASDGAFGAGVLVGLSKRGERPGFALVSGVSAGALIAPLAFLGPDYDDELIHAWTSGIAEPLGEGGVLSILFSQESRRAALYALVSGFADAELLRRIGAEYERGRHLVVVTTNLDAQRPVVWDLGKIAASGAPDALDLFRNILTASSSVPGIFAPTLIEVEADGRRFQELHVDGGATMQVFTVPESILAGGAKQSRNTFDGLPINFYVIINNRLKPDFEMVEASTAPMLVRSLSSLIKTHARLTLVATREFARNRGIGFRLAFIGDDFPVEPKPSFATSYMRSIYGYGYEKALSGKLWQSEIPFINGVRETRAVSAATR